MSLRTSFKGWLGEILTIVTVKMRLNRANYTGIHNVTIQTRNGTTQIDHVIASRYGIFVVESKNMSGWIFGDKTGREWTQILSRQRFKFQNPLHQNYRHARALSEFLGIDQSRIFPVVMFWGNCQLRTDVPPNVLKTGLAEYIKSKRLVLFDDADVKWIVAALKHSMLPRTWTTHRRHVAWLKERFDSTTTCAKCGNPMILRTARSGGYAGSHFYGCTNYPACRYIKRLEQPVSA